MTIPSYHFGKLKTPSFAFDEKKLLIFLLPYLIKGYEIDVEIVDADGTNAGLDRSGICRLLDTVRSNEIDIVLMVSQPRKTQVSNSFDMFRGILCVQFI